nr:DUF2946 family protein [Dyella sp. ASV21]
MAWLAMALIVVAPAISRVMPMPASMHAMMGSDCPQAMSMGDHAPAPDHPSDTTDRCGYCVLLEQQSLLLSAGVPTLWPQLPTPLVAPRVALPRMDRTPRLSADPRGPPSLA